MSKRCVGIIVSGDAAVLVDANVPKEGPISVISDQTFRLQQGEKSLAYAKFYDTVSNYVREQKIEKVIIKASALGTGPKKLAHLEAAELRGVVISACAAITSTILTQKATLSRNFGERKIDEYVSDDDFWDEYLSEEGLQLRRGSREAAIIIIANR